ncbi:MAG: RluA family pseudouridine synthase [Gammaproteobacteria bacterium]|nr:RluA family pseudouridine synthase [Gammaproteobacteria bacterium]MBT8110995.1 RluA family pseudouridine synthase [Gammaproteobacteria bacterium]NND48431.1 RluA family pseudouridine synthase [Woeseiaceae bacterium]NNL45693.1 RluA family pseudouridine synthase [Woeseiaceae bacterium]
MQEKSRKSGESRVTGVRKVSVDANRAGQRIDNFLRGELPGVPKGRVYRLLRRGEVRVNGGRVRAEYKLREGDVVRVPPARINTGAAPPPDKLAASMLDRVLYEDKRLLVIDKPTGVAVHGGSGISHGVIELVRHARPDLEDLSLVHRIDRETSGCLVMAKRRSALRELHARFREGKVEKNYLALVIGDWQYGEQLIDVPLLVQNRKGGERHVIVSDKGKTAKTRVSLSRTYGIYSLMQCSPVTGRTHQIRVHLAHTEHPIAGDERYGDEEANNEAKKFGLPRLFLHAQSIAFVDDSGNDLHFTSPLPDDLERFLTVGVVEVRRARKT